MQQGCHLDVVHHLQIEVVFGAFQNQGAAHVGRRVVEVKDDVVGVGAPLRSEYPVDFLGSLHLVEQVIPSLGAAGISIRKQSHANPSAVHQIIQLKDH